jgi:hypothetical protein
MRRLVVFLAMVVALSCVAIASYLTLVGLKGKVKSTTLLQGTQKIETVFYGTDGNRIEMSTWETNAPITSGVRRVSSRTLYANDKIGRRYQDTLKLRPRILTPEELIITGGVIPLEVYCAEYRWFARLADGTPVTETIYNEFGQIVETIDYQQVLMSLVPYRKVISCIGRNAFGTVTSIRTIASSAENTVFFDTKVTTLEEPIQVLLENYAYSKNDTNGNWTIRVSPADGKIVFRTLEYYP